MTSNTHYLYETLTRRMVRGVSNKGDVPLLWRLLVCQRRRWLTTGLVLGAGGTALAQFVATQLF